MELIKYIAVGACGLITGGALGIGALVAVAVASRKQERVDAPNPTVPKPRRPFR
jgi:hypothetical protein